MLVCFNNNALFIFLKQKYQNKYIVTQGKYKNVIALQFFYLKKVAVIMWCPDWKVGMFLLCDETGMWPGTNFELQGEESISGTFCAL